MIKQNPKSTNLKIEMILKFLILSLRLMMLVKIHVMMLQLQILNQKLTNKKNIFKTYCK